VQVRELVVLGTASQAPTRYRNHNGYFLRWDDAGFLFDPGEGTQRQMLLAGVRSSSITHICVTHFHGDHCLGVPGVVQRMSLDAVAHPVDLYYPAGGEPFVERLLGASIFERRVELHRHAVAVPAPPRATEPSGAVDAVESGPLFTLGAARLDHGPETLGWRIEEPPGRTMLPERLDAVGVRGPDVGLLLQRGSIAVAGRAEPVRLEEVSVARAGQVMAFVMDTAPCAAARALAEQADLLVCEATFAESDAELAGRYRHLTARQAGRLAAEAGARRLVITHFSQRYADAEVLLAEASAEFAEVVCAHDLLTVPVPARAARPGGGR
jgi:ribonuclease Z